MTQLEDVIQNFRPQMLLFSSELGILKDTIEKSIKTDVFTEYSSLQKEINKLLNKILDSEVFYEYSKDKTMRPLSGASYSFEADYSEKSEKFFKALSSASDTIRERYDEKKKEEIKVFQVECREQLEQEFKHQLEQMAQKIADTEEDVKQEKELKKQVEDQLESITAEKNHLKTELETLKNFYDEENKAKILKERKEINQQLVQDTYYSETSEYEVFDENFCLRLGLSKRSKTDSDKKMKNFINKVRFSKAILPDIKRINIENSDNDDSDLKEFLSTCFPYRLELFYFNSQGNLDFYKEALQQSLPNITREIFLNG
jgi:chromosome segregation ATPase